MSQAKQPGSHYYRGRFNSRGKRTMSKLHKGLPANDLTCIFQKIENERKTHDTDSQRKAV